MADRRVKFVFEGDTRDLEQALKAIRQDASQTAAEVEDAGEGASEAFAGVGAAVATAGAGLVAFGAAATAALVETVQQVIELSDEANQLAKSARAVGASVEDIQLLQGAMDLLTRGGVDASRAIQDLQRNMADARDGTGEAQAAFVKLGLSAEDLAELPVSEQVARIADRMGGLEDAAERTQVAMDIFGRSGRGMAEAFALGGDAVREATQEIADAGIISAEVAADSERLQDQILLTGAAFDTLKREFLAPMIPSISAVLAVWRELMVELGRADEVAEAGGLVGTALEEITLKAAVEVKGLLLTWQHFSETTIAGFKAVSDAYGAMRARLEGDTETANKLWRSSRLSAEDAAEGIAESLEGLSRGTVLTTETRLALIQYRAELRRVVRTERERQDVISETPAMIREVTAAVKDQASEEERLAGELAEGKLSAEENLQAELAALRESELEANLESIEARKRAEDELLAKRQQAAADAQRAVMAMTSAIVSLTGAVVDAVIEGEEEGTQARKDAAMAGFVIMKIAAVAEAAVSTALAIVNSLAVGLPVGAVLAAAAGIAGAAATAAIIAQPPPSFHAGGLVSGAVSAPDEVQIRALRGETVVTQADTRAAGGALGVRDAVRGGGSRQIVVVNQVGPKVVDAQTHEALRTGTGTLAQQFRAVRPRKVGRRNPYEGT
tara:strand:- start:563 stop:2581 length:2019 start_codon:yes stop_codon:yes gene_type:complete